MSQFEQGALHRVALPLTGAVPVDGVRDKWLGIGSLLSRVPAGHVVRDVHSELRPGSAAAGDRLLHSHIDVFSARLLR